MNRLIHLLCASLLLVLAACGGGGGTEPPEPPPPAAVARLEIVQTGAILTAAGATRQLEARAYDAQGNLVEADVSWSSNTPGEIAVDAGGVISAQRANGSAQIVAQAQGIKSLPLLAVATPLPPGAIALTDEQIVGDPVETDPDAAPGLANTYRALLTGVSAPAVGALLINTGSKTVAGRVVAVQAQGEQTQVTLRVVPLREMLPGLALRQTIDLSQAPLTINPEIEAAYDVLRDGDTLTFTPKPGTSAAPRAKAAKAGRDARAQAARGPLECELSVSTINISVPPTFSVTQNFALDLAVSAAHGVERLVARGEVNPSVQVGVEISAGLNVSFECKAELFKIRIPVGGPLAFFIGGVVPFEAGFEGGIEQTAVTVGLGVQVQAKANAEFGLACPVGGECEFVRSVTGEAEAKPEWNLPSLGDLRVKPSIGAFGRVKLEIGNPFMRSLRMDTFYAQAGPKLEGSFAPVLSQVIDTAYKSDYKAAFEAKAGVGADLGDALEFLGLETLAVVELAESVDIGRSPTGSMSADRAGFAAGEVVNFHVTLDAGTLDFLPVIGPYNAKQIVIYRVPAGNSTWTEVARVSASAGQAEFDLAYTAADSGAASEFTAFVVTTLLPADVFALEVGTPRSVRISADLPESIDEEAAFTVTVENSDGGPYQPAPGLLVSLAPSCGIVVPTSGRTDAAGRLAAGIGVIGCAESVAVTVEVRADEGTPVLARTTLDAVVGGFEFGDDIYLDSQAKIAAFNASGITRVVGNLSVELDEDPDDGGGGETALNATLPGVVSVGGSLSVQGPLTALSMPALTEVGGSLYIDRITTPVSASFSSLRQLGGELYVSRNTGLGSMNFGQLKTLNGLYVTGNSGLGSANFPQLESVGNDGLFVTDNIGLTSASFPQLASVLQAHGGIFITDNESISSLKIGPALIAATSGGLFITGNAVLSNLANVSCEIVSPGGVFITDNPAIPEDEVKRVVDCIRD
ncbi:MAG: hypothetical protein KA151_07685 [Piscinibacter sp.]|nr:hypothetical protein [Piscinibacter sp.]